MTGEPAGKAMIIAEAGINHNGDPDIAIAMVDVAAAAGADIVKFQIWTTDHVIARGAPKAAYQNVTDDSADQYEMSKNLELSNSDFVRIWQHCQEVGIGFLATPEDLDGLKFLTQGLGLELLKISSGELDNLVFLREVAKTGRDVVLSTGMAGLDEVRTAFRTLTENGARSVTVLHCTSNYPTLPTDVNLHAMQAIQRALDVPVGYSDHTLGIEVSLAAVALGASVVEKHFTLDRTMSGPDQSASIEPAELAALVAGIRKVEAALGGSGRKEPRPSEDEVRRVVRKGPYTARAMRAGEPLRVEDLHFKRPVRMIQASAAPGILGQRLVRDLPAGHPIEWADLGGQPGL